MNLFEQRRRMLLSALNNIFMIYNSEFYAGGMIVSDGLSTTKGIITIMGYKSTSQSNTIGEPASNWSSLSAYVASLEAKGYTVINSYEATGGNGTLFYYAQYTYDEFNDAYITIGSYDFTKYKTLNFTISDYSDGTCKVSFGDYSYDITANGEYSIDIKSCEGTYDIKFEISYPYKLSINNIYLK